jgi:Tfp pilus assembly protein PilN
MEKEGLLLDLKFQNNEIPTALLAGLVVIGIIILILGSALIASESKNNQQEFIDRLKEKEEKLKEREEKLHQIQEQLKGMR